jgi:chromosome segregation ATPase
MLLLLPSRVNDVLTKAGFTSASILGFEWEKQLEKSSKETEAAKQEVQRLNKELGAHVAQIEEFAGRVTEPATRRQADDLARSLRASQATTQKISAQLGRNLTAQKELQSEIRRRIPPRTP